MCIRDSFRTFEQSISTPHGDEVRGYHKPIMLAGGMGNIVKTTCRRPRSPLAPN